MRICDRGVNWVQVINEEGDCCTCSWANNNIIGNILHEDMKSIMYSKAASEFRDELQKGTYRNCNKEFCKYRANGNMNEILIDIEELPEYPRELHLAYEGVCNYKCTCCTSYQHMQDAKQNDYVENIEKIEEKMRALLPYVKTVGANGRGELFVSKSILKLLREWKPIAPKEEITVVLETNGSLFDEKHWKEIENLGQYNLKVGITVMSFNESIYQHLSGTKLPISQIENNLRYVKHLREQGVINYLELATVLQEENFREIPEFTRRCIEEFGADKVRIRPVFPGGIYDNNIQWFMDVRNPEHPYYEQYVEVMKNPIFKNPKVLIWTGDIASPRGKHPGEKSAAIQKVIDKLLVGDVIKELQQRVEEKDIVIYGAGTVGKVLLQLGNESLRIKEVYDKNSSLKEYKGISIKPLSCRGVNHDVVVVTVYGGFENIKKTLRENGYLGEVINIYEV